MVQSFSSLNSWFNSFINSSSVDLQVSQSKEHQKSWLTAVTSPTKLVAHSTRQWESQLMMIATLPPEVASGMKMLNFQDHLQYGWDNKNTYLFIISKKQQYCKSGKAFCIHHTEINEVEGLKLASGERFIENLEKIIRDNSRLGPVKSAENQYYNFSLINHSKGAESFVTPVKDDRRQETPAKRMRRKIISYRDLDRPSEGPDLRKDFNLKIY